MISAFDIQKGNQLWTEVLNKREDMSLYISTLRGEQFALQESEYLLLLERQGCHRIPVGSFGPASVSADACSIAIVRDRNELILLDREGYEQWRWVSEIGPVTFPCIKTDGSVVAVVGVTTLCHFSSDGELLDQWEIAPGLRLYIDGNLDDDHFLVKATSLGSHPGLLLLDLRSHQVTKLSDTEVSVIRPHGDVTAPYAEFPSGKISAVGPMGLVDRPRHPRPQWGKFPRLMEGTIGIYHRSGELVAADASGSKIWERLIPCDSKELVWGAQHVVMGHAEETLVWGFVGQ